MRDFVSTQVPGIFQLGGTVSGSKAAGRYKRALLHTTHQATPTHSKPQSVLMPCRKPLKAPLIKPQIHNLLSPASPPTPPVRLILNHSSISWATQSHQSEQLTIRSINIIRQWLCLQRIIILFVLALILQRCKWWLDTCHTWYLFHNIKP